MLDFDWGDDMGESEERKTQREDFDFLTDNDPDELEI